MPQPTDHPPTLRQSSSFVSRRIGDEMILVPIRQHGAELTDIVRLNEVAAFIWEQLGGEVNEEELLQALLSRYEVAADLAAADLKELLRRMGEIGAIEAR